jgi:hypothetical protein
MRRLPGGGTADPGAGPRLARFPAVNKQERSPLVWPDVLAALGQGYGGSTPERPRAALTRPGRLERRSGRLDGPRQEGRAAAPAAVLPGPWPAGALRLADVGSWRRDAVPALGQPGVCWLSRRQTPTALCNTTGCRRAGPEGLEAAAAAAGEQEVGLGGEQRVLARLLAVRGRQDVADGRRRRWRGAARQQGRQVRATRLARAAWTVLVPTGPADRLVLREALVLGRVRWQMAWLCQVGKSPGGVDASRRTKPWRVLGEGSAQLRAMLRQHGLCRGSCWAYPKRSLGKAAQTVRKEALRLASALHDLLSELAEVL